MLSIVASDLKCCCQDNSWNNQRQRQDTHMQLQTLDHLFRRFCSVSSVSPLSFSVMAKYSCGACLGDSQPSPLPSYVG